MKHSISVIQTIYSQLTVKKKEEKKNYFNLKPQIGYTLH